MEKRINDSVFIYEIEEDKCLLIEVNDIDEYVVETFMKELECRKCETKLEKMINYGFYPEDDHYYRFKVINDELMIGDVKIANRVFLAPMAGICNEATRMVVKKMGVGLVYAEMVSDKALNYKNSKTIDMIKVNENEHPISMQVFGSEIDMIIEAAKMIDQTSSDIIDINMGCPVAKVAKKSGAGSALLKDPDKVFQIVQSVVKAVKKPVSVKIRSGWDAQNINAVLIAKLCEKAGAKMIAVHPRTRSQLYSGLSDWKIIKAVKEAVNIPVVGNGDIKTPKDARRMMEETGCDAVMIGRGSLGNPWLFLNVINELNGNHDIYTPSYAEIRDMIHFHTEYLSDLKCEKVAILEMRNHAAWYLKGLPCGTSIKKDLYKTKTKEELYSLIDPFFEKLINLD